MQTRLSPWSVVTTLQTFLAFEGLGKSAGTVSGRGCAGDGWWGI
ncbi:MAG TPA: hypothetical protein VJN66_04535 [Rhodanobacteraceae bacterium]|nr:hypothetical protein [Rhodanobacteraceae bacterium]